MPKTGSTSITGRQSKAMPIRSKSFAKEANAAAHSAGGRPGASKSAAGAVSARIYHPGARIDGEAALQLALAELQARDPEMIRRLLDIGGPPPLRLRAPGFEGLVAIVLAQQVSVGSANAIGGRLKERVVPLTPASIVASGDDVLRACGLSAPKIRTLRALSTAILSGALDLDALAAIEPAEAHRQLVAVSGIGPWTADIFLLFCLGHPDAWPAGDLALQEAARLVLALNVRPDARALEAIGERWRPCRGVAARLLWAAYRALKQGREGVIGTPT